MLSDVQKCFILVDIGQKWEKSGQNLHLLAIYDRREPSNPPEQDLNRATWGCFWSFSLEILMLNPQRGAHHKGHVQATQKGWQSPGGHDSTNWSKSKAHMEDSTLKLWTHVLLTTQAICRRQPKCCQ